VHETFLTPTSTQITPASAESIDLPQQAYYFPPSKNASHRLVEAKLGNVKTARPKSKSLPMAAPEDLYVLDYYCIAPPSRAVGNVSSALEKTLLSLSLRRLAASFYIRASKSTPQAIRGLRTSSHPVNFPSLYAASHDLTASNRHHITCKHLFGQSSIHLADTWL
jgi:hypothetical protein